MRKNLVKVAVSIILVLAVIFIVPIIVYGFASSLIGAKMPEEVSPLMFLLGVFISKTGTAIAFTLLFYFARKSLSNHWVLYACIWWLMFVIGEVGQTFGPNYSWKEAIAGVISETIYFPLSAYVVHKLIKVTM